MVTSPSPTTAAIGASIAGGEERAVVRELLARRRRRAARRAQIDGDEVVAVGAVDDDVGGGAVGGDAHGARARRGERLADGLGAILVDAQEVELAVVDDDGEAADGEASSARGPSAARRRSATSPTGTPVGTRATMPPPSVRATMVVARPPMLTVGRRPKLSPSMTSSSPGLATPSGSPFQAPAFGRCTAPASRMRLIDGGPKVVDTSRTSTTSGKPLEAQPASAKQTGRPIRSNSHS